jgi:hypothetical protein
MRLEALAGLLANLCAVVASAHTAAVRRAVSTSRPPRKEPPERGDELGRELARMTGSRFFLDARVVPYGRPIGFRDAGSPAMADSASPLDQRKAMTGEPIALLWVALTSRTLQCLDSSAAQRFALVFFPFGVEFGHDPDRVIRAMLVNGCSGE